MLSLKARRYTRYRKERTLTHRLWRVLRVLIVLFLFYVLFHAFLLQSYQVTSVSMTPSFQERERLFASPLAYGARLPGGKSRLPGFSAPSRGDVVVAKLPYAEARSWPVRIADSVVRFFTGQRVTPGSSRRPEWAGQIGLFRIVGLPGDTVRMTDHICYVQPAGKEAFVSEFELSGKRYELGRQSLPDGWFSDLPFSGFMKAVTVPEGYYFLVTDNRFSGIDSRYFGPVAEDAILQRIVFRYWPPARFGVPGS